jgi:PAS domain-containing protein
LTVFAAACASASRNFVADARELVTKAMRQSGKSKLKNYGFALLSVSAAFALIQIFPPLKQRGGIGLLLCAVAISAWRGGFGPAIAGMTVSVLGCAWWILPPNNSLRISKPDDIARLGIFVFVSLLISSLHASRAKAEKKSRASDQRLGFALESSGVGCWEVDVAAGQFWNSANLAAIYGRTANDFATTYEGFFAYIHPEDRDFFRLASVRPQEGGRDYQITHRIICGDGSIRRVNTRGRMYLDESGKVVRMVGAVHEIDQTSLDFSTSNFEPASAQLARASN